MVAFIFIKSIIIVMKKCFRYILLLAILINVVANAHAFSHVLEMEACNIAQQDSQICADNEHQSEVHNHQAQDCCCAMLPIFILSNAIETFELNKQSQKILFVEQGFVSNVLISIERPPCA